MCPKINEHEEEYMKSQRIMLWGWFGFENLGDDLLLNTMISKLLAKDRLITIPMQSKYVIEQENVKQISRSYKELVKGAFNNDVLIIGPGGLFPFDNPKKVLIYFFITLLWKLCGRKVAYFGVGISERMSNLSKKLWRSITILSDLFFTRSPSVIEELGLVESPRIQAMADAVFASNVEFIRCLHTNKIGIFVANLQQEGMERTYKSFVQTWQKTILALLERGFSVDLIAFTKNTDDQLITDIASAFLKRGGVRTVRYENSFDAIKKMQEYKITISMRFHALVLSLLANVPSVPIAYGQKTYSLALRSGLSEYVLIWNSFQKEYYGYVQELSADDLIEKVDLLISNYDQAKGKIACNTEELKTSSRNAMIQLLKLVGYE